MTPKRLESIKKGIYKIENYFSKRGFNLHDKISFFKSFLEGKIDVKLYLCAENQDYLFFDWNKAYTLQHFFNDDFNNGYSILNPSKSVIEQYDKSARDFFDKHYDILEAILNYIDGTFETRFSKDNRGYVLEILEEEEFKPLAKYLKECHNCLSQGLNFAGAVCFRTCLEIVISSFNQGRNLEKKIENFFKQIEEIATFQNVIAFKDSLNNLFTTIREAGNDVAHFKKDIEVIEQNLENMEETFATFCFILEKTLFKDKIQQKREEAERKELEEKLVNKNKPEDSFENEPEVSIDKNFTSIDDDIPF